MECRGRVHHSKIILISHKPPFQTNILHWPDVTRFASSQVSVDGVGCLRGAVSQLPDKGFEQPATTTTGPTSEVLRR